MTNTLYVSNLAFQATEEEIQAHFSTVGEVTKVQIILDRETRRPRGFGFVSYATAELAAEALSKFNGTNFMGRDLRITEARPREERPPGQNDSRPHKNSSAPRTHYSPAPRRDSTPPLDLPPAPYPPIAEPQSRFGPPRKKFNKDKSSKHRRQSDDFDRPKSRRPRPDSFDDEEF